MWLVYIRTVLQSECRVLGKLSRGTLGGQPTPVHCLCFPHTSFNGRRPYSECKSRMEHPLSVSGTTNCTSLYLLRPTFSVNGGCPLGTGLKSTGIDQYQRESPYV